MRRNFWRAALIAAIIVLGSTLAWSVTRQYHVQRGEQILGDNTMLAVRALESELSRIDTLIGLLHEDTLLVDAIETPETIELGALIDHLNVICDRIGARQIFVVDDQGMAIVSSAWRDTGPAYRLNLASRPYFQEAMKTSLGMVLATAYSTGTPSLFLSTRVDLPSGKSGVVVATVDLLPMETTWWGLNSSVALIDRNGIVLLSNRDDWKYRPAFPLSAERLASIARDYKYGMVDITTRDPLFDETPDPSDGIAKIAGKDFQVHMEDVDGYGWKIVAARSIIMANTAANLISLLVFLIGLIAAGSMYIYHQREMLMRLKNEQSALLEQKVEERTRELANEMENRRRTEECLYEAEQDLVQAAKLATLGQMSAALAHEVSQPVTALAAMLTAVERRLDAGETRDAQKVLERSQNLVQRIQHIIRHLRSFSKKEHGEGTRIVVSTSIKAALELVEMRAREIDVTIKAEDLDQRIAVFGNAIRLEQVLINLLLNALDAVNGCAHHEVGIRLVSDGPVALIDVWDSGPGIPDGLNERLSEPFFTTKADQDGVGLGLSISQTILSDFGASMRFLQRKGGGTICRVRLPLAKDDQVEAAE